MVSKSGSPKKWICSRFRSQAGNSPSLKTNPVYLQESLSKMCCCHLPPLVRRHLVLCVAVRCCPESQFAGIRCERVCLAHSLSSGHRKLSTLEEAVIFLSSFNHLNFPPPFLPCPQELPLSTHFLRRWFSSSARAVPVLPQLPLSAEPFQCLSESDGEHIGSTVILMYMTGKGSSAARGNNWPGGWLCLNPFPGGWSCSVRSHAGGWYLLTPV